VPVLKEQFKLVFLFPLAIPGDKDVTVLGSTVIWDRDLVELKVVPHIDSGFQIDRYVISIKFIL
jgi:hypothetical protein